MQALKGLERLFTMQSLGELLGAPGACRFPGR
jgi:hypothetical protein